MLDVENKYVRCKDIIIKSINDLYYAFNLSDGSEYKINEVSYDILEFLAEPHYLKEVFENIVKVYDVSEEQLRDDMELWFDFALSHMIVQTYYEESN